MRTVSHVAVPAVDCVASFSDLRACEKATYDEFGCKVLGYCLWAITFVPLPSPDKKSMCQAGGYIERRMASVSRVLDYSILRAGSHLWTIRGQLVVQTYCRDMF